MKSLTQVVPVPRGQKKCKKTLQQPPLIDTEAIMASTNHSPFFEKGARGILPPLTPPKSGGELEVLATSFSTSNYVQGLLDKVSRKEMPSC